ncbi:MAG: hypothetical protein HRT87_12175, partial [Legionellales bacterium]|nr:hypothetical protein [Legionellales bacterium]
MFNITSIKDPIIEGARKLQSSAHRKKSGKMLLYGVEQLLWAENAHITIEYIFVEQGNSNIV